MFSEFASLPLTAGNVGPGFTAAVLTLIADVSLATADGPDFFSVTGVADDALLSIRADSRATKVGEIPPDGTCICNLGCKGGLTFQEFTELSPALQAERLKENPRWCDVEYRGVIGWVAGNYLREDRCEE